jgi:hypothetical protein
LAIEPYDTREATLVLRKEKFQHFPLNSKSNFTAIRVDPRFAYFDRTRYISVLESFPDDVLLFLRPRRFGKSLFLSTLAHFHGVEHKQNYKALFQVRDNGTSFLYSKSAVDALFPLPCRALMSTKM